MAATTTTTTTSTTTTALSAPDPTAQLYRQIFTRIDQMNEADRGRIGLCGSDGCWVVTTPLDTSTAAMLKQQTDTIALIRKAAAMPPPHWQLDGDSQKMADLANRVPFCSSLLVLQARQEFADNKASDGIDDLIAALTVSRHASANEPTILTKMIESLAWRPAGTELAKQLPSLPKDLLAALPPRLAALPPSPDTAPIIRGEYAFAQQTARRQNFTVVALVAGMRDFYKACLDGADRSPADFDKLVDEQAKVYGNNAFVPLMAPQMKRLRQNVIQLQALHAMMLTAIDILQHGDAALAASKDPGSNAPFAMVRTSGGFVLTSAVPANAEKQTLSLRVGRE
jgi:hypothetical protein